MQWDTMDGKGSQVPHICNDLHLCRWRKKHHTTHCANPKETPSSELSWSSTFNWHYIAFEFGVTVANHGRRHKFCIAGGASGLFGNFIACDHGDSIGVDPDAPFEKKRRFHHFLESSQSRSRGSLSAFDGRSSRTWKAWQSISFSSFKLDNDGHSDSFEMQTRY